RPGNLAAKVIDLAPQLQRIDFRHDAALHERLGDSPFLVGEREARAKLLELAVDLGNFLLTLLRLLTQDGNLRLQLCLPGAVEILFAHGDVFALRHQFRRKFERRVRRLGLKTGNAAHEIKIVRLDLPGAGGGAGIVDMQQDLPFLDDIAFMHQQFAQDAAFEILDDLHLTGGDDLTIAARHLIEHCRARPDEGDDEKGKDSRQQHEGARMRALQLCRHNVRCEIRVFPFEMLGHGYSPGSRSEGRVIAALTLPPPWPSFRILSRGPSAAIRPLPSTMIRSTSEKSDVRWVTRITVLSAI